MLTSAMPPADCDPQKPASMPPADPQHTSSVTVDSEMTGTQPG
jgi:hypothetical protein